MTTTAHIEKQLQDLVAQDSTISQQMLACGDMAAAAAFLGQAAQSKGIDLNPSELLEYFQQKVLPDSGALSDLQLEGVAGGMDYGEFVGMSVGTASIGCLIASCSNASVTGVPNDQKDKSFFCKRQFQDGSWMHPQVLQ
jgi:hypothetical protein